MSKLKKKPDRFARVVEKLYHHVWMEGKIPYPHVERLLNREHRAVVGMVKKMERYMMGVHIMMPKAYGAWINAEDLLAALAKRAT